METLIAKIPKAYKFCELVRDNISEYKLYPNEKFDTIIYGVLTTTERDSQGDCLSMVALDNFLNKIRKRTIWLTAEHNPLIQPIGRLIAAERFYDSGDDIYFIAGVIGNYDISSILSFDDIGVNITNIPQIWPALPQTIGQPLIELYYNPHETKDEIIKEMLNNSPEVVADKPKIRIRKAAEPMSIIIEISITIGLLAALSFVKSFSSRLGTRAVDLLVKRVNTWLKSKVVRGIVKVDSDPFLFEFTSEYKGCRIRFVVPSKDQELLNRAINKVGAAARSAVGLIEKVEQFKPTYLVYVFDLDAKSWFPRHLATEKLGVISEKAIEVDLKKYKGLSIDGVAYFKKDE